MGCEMTNEQKMHISEVLMARAEISGRVLSKPAIRMMIEDLSDLPFEAVYRVLQGWGKHSSDFPSPAKIRERLAPETSDADDGRDIASRVIGAVSKFGWNQPLQAKLYIGEIGWECVSRIGGWVTFCSELNDENKGIYNAQIRDLSMTLKKKAVNGTLNQPINFPTPIESAIVKKMIGSFTDKES